MTGKKSNILETHNRVVFSSNLLSFLLRSTTRPYEEGTPMRLEFTRESLLVTLANHYTTRGAKPGSVYRVHYYSEPLYTNLIATNYTGLQN